MGTDIHAFIDYEQKDSENNIYIFNFGEFRITRNYWLFSLLAGVRCTNIQGQKSLIPKGMPDNISYQVRKKAYLYVVDKKYPDEIGVCTKKEAEKWGNNYVDENWIHHPDWHSHSWLTTKELGLVLLRYKKLNDKQLEIIPKNKPIPKGYRIDKTRNYTDSNYKWIYKDQKAKIPEEIEAIYSCMKILDKSELNPKLIFYFDN